MSQQVEIDRQLVKNLIASKNPVFFLRRFKHLIYQAIDEESHLMDPESIVTLEEKKKLLKDFMDNLLAHRFQSYLNPKRMKVDASPGQKNEYHLVGSKDIIDGKPINIKEDTPDLGEWLRRQCEYFFRAKFIVNGLLSRNINVIKTFFFSNGRPGCREMFSGWIFENGVFSGSSKDRERFVDSVIHEYVNKLYVDIEKDKIEREEWTGAKDKFRRKPQAAYLHVGLTTLKNFRFEGSFYSYFRDWVVVPYMKSEFGLDEIQPIPIDDNKDDDDVKRPIEIISPDNPYRSIEARDSLDKIFEYMRRTEAGRRQVEVLELMFIPSYEGRIPTDEQIARKLEINVSNLRRIKSQALDKAKEIGKKLNLRLTD